MPCNCSKKTALTSSVVSVKFVNGDIKSYANETLAQLAIARSGGGVILPKAQ